MSNKQDKDLPVKVGKERRAARCAKGETCEVAERQQVLVKELQDHREELCEIKDGVNEMLELFKASKAVVNFIKKTGHLVRWVAITGAGLTAVWASITHWPKH